ncbi:membrane-bound lytic murein transglycosylase MltF [Marinobacterium weihaiense]|uniref:Membrane-bound lytic murein transglycosylase F n=1 Tax=Marinobacterium weihaiense TaxID=2851016 RepID=A0ABS6MB13_9GAMM|nr:membrane-bound lytic murein transglycosylase MltF [Marinobacterium weihaiense]MBV0933430.1 membrane-bound lytic murein transglycosylase MltF [Marinobacterium weihaiense]
MFKLRQAPYLRALIYVIVLATIAAGLTLMGLNTPTQLEAIKAKGSVRFATTNTPLTYYIRKGKPAGFEYELARAFADHLGVKLELALPGNFAGLFDVLQQRNAHIAAASLTATPARRAHFDFSPAYRQSAPVVIYRVRRGNPAPDDIRDLQGRSIEVLPGSSHIELLHRLRKQHPELNWRSRPDDTVTDLLDRVHAGELDYTILDSTVFEAQKSFHPGLKAAFALQPPQPVAWMLNQHHDGTLKAELDRWFNLDSTQKLIKTLEERYFARTNPLNFFDTVTFRRDLEERFLPLLPWFQQAAEETGINWLLLAAIAYQESHWKADAVSPTGVRGIMMLTNAAAREVDVRDRTDARQSIMGGARYLTIVKKKIPDRIPEPDHTWFALAGYNVGFGHLEDARILTQKAGKNPDKWQHVREFLPKLSHPKYYAQTRYGYARGHEPVQYVSNIRKYMELLRWEVDSGNTLELPTTGKPPVTETPVTPENPAPDPLRLNNLPTTL